MIPPYASVRKFIPADKLWPVNEYWYLHAGGAGDGMTGNDALTSKQLACQSALRGRNQRRTSRENRNWRNTRIPGLSLRLAAKRWATHKMTIYWRLE